MLNRTTRRRRGQQRSHGQVMIAFTIMFMFFLFGAIGGVLDLAVLFSHQSVLNKAAQDGAIAGAADIDVPYFRTTGKVRLCTAVGPCTVTAQMVCTNTIATDMLGATWAGPRGGGCPQPAAATPFQLTATVSDRVQVPINVGLGTPTIAATYTAFAQCGTKTPAAFCN